MKRNVALNLPKDFRQIDCIDLDRDRKCAKIIDIAAIIVMIGMGFGLHMFVPISILFSMQKGFGLYTLRFTVVFLGMFGYISLHELTRGLIMKVFGAQNVNYGFSQLYTYVKCNTFFAKKEFIKITLSPLIIWGSVFLIINVLVPHDWIWVVYMLQMMNISGATGDVYMVMRAKKAGEDIWIKDDGRSIQIYAPIREIRKINIL